MKLVLCLCLSLMTISMASKNAIEKNRYSYSYQTIYELSNTIEDSGEFIFTHGFQEVLLYNNGNILRLPTFISGNGPIGKFDNCSTLEGPFGKIYFCGDNDAYIVNNNGSIHYFNK